jgi:exopolyphosphatase / guanosine-5'-triphosphate,3'-diphosphate pyrophosphatase
MATPTRFAVLDLGSTTFQLLVADADRDGSLTPVLRDRVVLNLGRVLAEETRIPDDVAGRAAETARRLTDIAARTGADHLVPLATSALRDSPDREELEELFEGAIGAPVRFIDGREEARLTFAGVAASVALGEGPTLLLDLGGGSLEVALADADGLRWGRSLPVGAGRLSGLLVSHDPPTRDERKAVRAAAEDAVAPLVPEVEAAEAVRCIASGGTAGALARVLAAERWGAPPTSLNQFELSVAELRELTRDLAALSLDERLRVPGVDERRAELLPAGGWILTSAAAAFGVKRLVHSEWGLREGAVLDALGLAGGPAPAPQELRRRSVDRLVRAWGEDPVHVEMVARIAARIFDETEPLHGLRPTERELLTHAARLHEIGARVSPARLHKHGAYLVENAGMRGFDPDQVAVVASLVRFSRGKDPRPVYPPFAELPEFEQEAVVVMSGLLRVAHAIGRGPEGERLEVSAEVGDQEVRIGVSGSANPDAAVAEARQASPLLERALDRKVRIQPTLATAATRSA